VALLQDLSGPKIRTGLLRDHTPIALAAGDELVIAVGSFLGAPGPRRHQLRIPAVSGEAGDTLLLDDGRIQLQVLDSDPQQIRTRWWMAACSASTRGSTRRRAAAGVRSHRQGQGRSGVRRQCRRRFRGDELRA
jgi:pyruvate kinase